MLKIINTIELAESVFAREVRQGIFLQLSHSFPTAQGQCRGLMSQVFLGVVLVNVLIPTADIIISFTVAVWLMCARGCI